MDDLQGLDRIPETYSTYDSPNNNNNTIRTNILAVYQTSSSAPIAARCSRTVGGCLNAGQTNPESTNSESLRRVSKEGVSESE